MTDQEAAFLIKSVAAVAEHGWKLLPHYKMDLKTGLWIYKKAEQESYFPDNMDLSQWMGYDRNKRNSMFHSALPTLEQTLEQGIAKLAALPSWAGTEQAKLPEELEKWRWFAVEGDSKLYKPKMT